MANPVYPVAVPEGVWTKVATANLGQVWRKKTTVTYLMTYRVESDPAPTTTDEAVKVFVDCESMPISNNLVIDVYLWAVGGDGVVRVDI